MTYPHGTYLQYEGSLSSLALPVIPSNCGVKIYGAKAFRLTISPTIVIAGGPEVMHDVSLSSCLFEASSSRLATTA